MNDVVGIEEKEEIEDVSYFFFSRQQQRELTDHSNQFGSRITFGEVLHDGSMKIYTEVNVTGDSSYSDAILITKGLLSNMIYTERHTESRRI